MNGKRIASAVVLGLVGIAAAIGCGSSSKSAPPPTAAPVASASDSAAEGLHADDGPASRGRGRHSCTSGSRGNFCYYTGCNGCPLQKGVCRADSEGNDNYGKDTCRPITGGLGCSMWYAEPAHSDAYCEVNH